MRSKVFVGISGGVDSAVAALLLQKQGYDVEGVFLKNWSGEEYGVIENCPWKDDLDSARMVASHLRIPLRVYNFEREYRDNVISDFFYQYSIGNTPNPDLLCNKFIKFDLFLNKAVVDGAKYIATGHYARTKSGKLFKPVDTKKDQTYFLQMLKAQQLRSVLFPLAKYQKKEVRELAKRYQLPNADRKDSQGICFIGEIELHDFLSSRLVEKIGNTIDIDTGNIIGKHAGVWFYTIGQRRGLAIGGSDYPYFVAKKDVNTNTLYVAKGRTNPSLWKKRVYTNQIHLINSNVDLTKGRLTAISRYRGEVSDISCMQTTKNEFCIVFKKPQWAPAMGQSIAIFKDDQCLGGCIISKID